MGDVMTAQTADVFNEQQYALDWIATIAERFPKRKAGSSDERHAQLVVSRELEAMGLGTEMHSFETNDNVYLNLAVHFGLGTLGSALSPFFPRAAFALHAGSAVSYLLDSTHSAHLLRSLLPQKTSHNLLAVAPATTAPKLRLVFLAHIDAAFTGLLFDPAIVRATSMLRPPRGGQSKPLALATYSQLALAATDLARWALGPVGVPLVPLQLALSLPGLLTFLLNLEVVVRNELVTGATDNLSGVAGMLLLAKRLVAQPHPDVEYVFVVTGAEEAGTMGSYSLARDKRAVWSPDDTVVIGMDGLCNGELCYFQEGELRTVPMTGWLARLLSQVANSDPRFESVGPFVMPVGGTDSLPFRLCGYDGVTIGCVDRQLGAPRHYHLPSDTPQNVDAGAIVHAVDFVEALVTAIRNHRAAGDR